MPVISNARADGLGMEVHVAAARDAAAQHFGDAEHRAVEHEVGRDEAAFARPDVLLEPGLERHVVGDAAQQRHRRVAVRVHEAGDRARGGRARASRAARSGRRRRPRGAIATMAPPSTISAWSVSTPAGSTGTIQRASIRKSTTVGGVMAVRLSQPACGSVARSALRSRADRMARRELAEPSTRRRKEKAPHEAGLFQCGETDQRLIDSPFTSTSTRRSGA